MTELPASLEPALPLPPEPLLTKDAVVAHPLPSTGAIARAVDAPPTRVARCKLGTPRGPHCGRWRSSSPCHAQRSVARDLGRPSEVSSLPKLPSFWLSTY